MAINENDKYYTPKYLVEKTIKKTLELIPLDEISDIIEPSAGDGAFLFELEKLKKPFTCFDILPENENIVEQDFLKLNIPYKKGRVIIGNPPYGDRGNIFRKFIEKSSQIADYIVFILPASQYNNNASFKKGKLIYSENLGSIKYNGKEDVNVRTCLNIYKTGSFVTPQKNYKICEDIDVRTVCSRGRDYKESDYGFDYYVINRGSALRIHKEPTLSSYYGIRIKNEKSRILIEKILNSLEDKYFEEVRANSVCAPGFNKSYLLKILEAEYIAIKEKEDELTRMNKIIPEGSNFYMLQFLKILLIERKDTNNRGINNKNQITINQVNSGRWNFESKRKIDCKIRNRYAFIQFSSKDGPNTNSTKSIMNSLVLN